MRAPARGLLADTLVICMGEFGRSPKINKSAGRDHWGSVYSAALAGGGVRGGQVIGASDAVGGQPKEGVVSPGDSAKYAGAYDLVALLRTATNEQIKQVEDAFRDLKKKIKEIQDYEWGTNVSKETRNKGCTHGFILTFKSETDRDTYIDHPAHKDFGKLVGPVLDDVFVIDFWAKD